MKRKHALLIRRIIWQYLFTVILAFIVSIIYKPYIINYESHIIFIVITTIMSILDFYINPKHYE